MKTLEKVLASDEQSRSAHKRLIVKVQEAYGLYLTPEQQEIFFKMPSPETITRTCRKFQEQGKYLGNKKITEYRKFKSLQVQQVVKQTKPEDIQQLFEVTEPTQVWR